MNGIELQDREFFAAIQEKREPNASVAQCNTAMQVLDRIERFLNTVGRERQGAATKFSAGKTAGGSPRHPRLQ